MSTDDPKCADRCQANGLLCERPANHEGACVAFLNRGERPPLRHVWAKAGQETTFLSEWTKRRVLERAEAREARAREPREE